MFCKRWRPTMRRWPSVTFISSSMPDYFRILIARFRNAIDQDQPVLPSLSGTAPSALSGSGIHSAPEIASLYNFPSGFDGRGVTVGIVEFGGKIVSADLTNYFKSISLPVPDIVPIYVDGGASKINDSSDADANVMMDVEIIGAIAPRARIQVYFAPNTSAGFARAIMRAAADGVGVLSIGWGQAENSFKDEDIKEINAALEQAARQSITVLASAGGQGVTAGVKDGRRHVDFPGSSPWVLSIGGTTLKSQNGRIISETVWRSGEWAATGGGVSEKFDRPDWQLNASIPNREDGTSGRGVPDVVATADPGLFAVAITVHGKQMAIGGTGATVPLWAALIARINQALGYNVGFLNPRLYQEMGPQGVFRAITVGHNSIGGVKGYSATSGWSPVAGWGSPDGVKLLSWLREHPNPPIENKIAAVTCRPSSK